MPALEFLAYALTRLCNAPVPAEIAAGLALALLTMLQKPGRGVCGIATGDVFRRLVSGALAKGWADTFDHATRPYQLMIACPGLPPRVAVSRARIGFIFFPKKQLVSTAARSASRGEHHAQRIGKRLGPIGSASAKTSSRGGVRPALSRRSRAGPLPTACPTACGPRQPRHRPGGRGAPGERGLGRADEKAHAHPGSTGPRLQ